MKAKPPAKTSPPAVATGRWPIRAPRRPGGGREERRHQRSGGEGEARAQLRPAPDFGQQEDAGEEHRAEAHEEDQRRQVGEGEGADPQQRQLDHRRVVVGGAVEEGGDEERPRRRRSRARGGSLQPHSGPWTMPRVRRPMPSASSAAPSRSGRPSSGSLHLVEDADRGERGDQADRHVDEEDPVPADLHEEAADRRAEGGGDAGDRRPDADRDRALLGREGGQEEAERGRDHHRRADRLQHAGADQEGDRGGGRAERRGDGEGEQAGDEDALAADPVGDPPGGDEQGGEDDRVAVQDPGEARQRGVVEGAREVGEGDVDDEQVEAGHEEADRGDASTFQRCAMSSLRSAAGWPRQVACISKATVAEVDLRKESHC